MRSFSGWLVLGGFLLLVRTLPDFAVYPVAPPVSALPVFAHSPIARDDSDYFDAIQPIPQGYLIWPERPVQVYVEPAASGTSAAAQQSRRWFEAVQGAIADWSPHMPLIITPDRDSAHIRVLRAMPPLRWPAVGSRARNAETRFRIFWRVKNDGGDRCFWQQQTVYLGDRQGSELLRGTARHELGHALGLWGHSLNPEDALYETQVGIPPQISIRDRNTLNRLNQQTTGLRCLGPGNAYKPLETPGKTSRTTSGTTL
jgi:predicted Zn-dependent protease